MQAGPPEFGSVLRSSRPARPAVLFALIPHFIENVTFPVLPRRVREVLRGGDELTLACCMGEVGPRYRIASSALCLAGLRVKRAKLH
eukprot:13539959-Alexandrium_andersonii.AAC.1